MELGRCLPILRPSKAVLVRPETPICLLPMYSTHFNPPTDNVSYQGCDPSAYSDGPVQVGYAGYYYSAPGSSAFVESLGVIGVSPINDLNSGINVGTKQEPLTLDTKHHRSSAYHNCYTQAVGRPNLQVLTYSPVQKFILEPKYSSFVATGVIYYDYASGSYHKCKLIMSAGSIQTPQLLLLSVSKITISQSRRHPLS